MAASPIRCAVWPRRAIRAARRRCICGTRPIAAKSTCASPATAPGSTRARRSAGRRWCKLFSIDPAQGPGAFRAGDAGRAGRHRGRGRALPRRRVAARGRGARARSCGCAPMSTTGSRFRADHPLRFEPGDSGRPEALCAGAGRALGAGQARAVLRSGRLGRAAVVDGEACSACGRRGRFSPWRRCATSADLT